MSPLLFVLAMEYFTRLMTAAGDHSLFRFRPSCKSLKLNHLMFVDDVLIFSKAHLPTLQIIHNTLEAFYKVAGLRANPEKSQIVCGGCNSQLQQQCLEATGYREGGLPMKYLGVPLTASRLSKLECHSSVDNIMGKMRQWSTRNLSFAGRALLINTVVFGMYGFWASIFILPQEVITRITQLCRNFLWGGTADYKRPPPISWDTICTPKKYGGLGLKNLTAWNKASVAKLVWCVALKKDMLWVKWVHEKYLKQNDWWSYQASYDSSWSWKKIVSTKEIFKQGFSQQPCWTW